MFNPFDEFILDKFLINNINHFQEHKSVIAYANDIHRESLLDFGFTTLYRNKKRKIITSPNKALNFFSEMNNFWKR